MNYMNCKKQIKTLILVLGAFLILPPLYAGPLPIPKLKIVTIKGKVTDRVTGQALRATVRILDATSGQSGIVTCDKQGVYSATTYPRFYTSIYKISARITGYATVAKTITVIKGRTYTVNFQLTDNVPPVINVTSPIDGSYTNQRSINVRGNVNERSTVTVNNVNASMSGNNFTADNVPLANEGINTITVVAIDLTGNRSAKRINLIRDITPPQIQIISPINNHLTNQTKINVIGAIIDVNKKSVTVNGTIAVLNGNTFTANEILLNTEGDNQITVIAQDNANNQSTQQINVIRYSSDIDITPPGIRDVHIEEGVSTTKKIIHIIMDVIDAEEMIVYEGDDIEEGCWEKYVSEKEIKLSSGLGQKNILLKFRDFAGNVTETVVQNIDLVPQVHGLINIMGRQLLVNGEPYIIKGVTYQPTPIGERPWLVDVYTEENCDRDFKLLRDMGCNTIRTYSVVTQTLLDKAWNNGEDPIRVCAGFWVSVNVDFSDPAVRESIINDFKNYVEEFKDHPAILMWVIGNEQNFSNGNNSDWYTLANEMAGEAHNIDGFSEHPAAVVNGDLYNIGDSYINADDESMYNVDIWGVNIYMGLSFGNFFSFYAGQSSKPLWISECGIDAWDTLQNREDQKAQEEWDFSMWNEINENLDICIGAVFMTYSDEWWKAPQGLTINHDYGGYDMSNSHHPESHPDQFSNEEWWGFVSVMRNGYGLPDFVFPRLVYYSLKQKWSLNSQFIDDFNDDNNKNNLNNDNLIFASADASCSQEYITEGSRQCLRLTYDTAADGSYAGFVSMLNGLNAGNYSNINFLMKGEYGGETVKLGLRDKNGNEAKVNILEYILKGVANEWNRVYIPLDAFGNVNINNLENTSLTFESSIDSNAGSILVDDLSFGRYLPSLVISNFDTSSRYAQNSLGYAPWTYSYTDSSINFTFDMTIGIYETPCLKVNYNAGSNSYCMLGLGLNGINVNKYKDLVFKIKGLQGGEGFHIYLEDSSHVRAHNDVLNITTEWQEVRIPVRAFADKGIDTSHLINLQIVFEEPAVGTIYFDDIEFGN